MASRNHAKLKILETLRRDGPCSGSDLRLAAGIPGGSVYTGLYRLMDEGLVKATGEPYARVWTITQAGIDTAVALRNLHNAEPF